MLLYHGTNTTCLKMIMNDGLIKGPVYLSDCRDIAWYFARLQKKDLNARPALLSMDVDPAKLIADETSLLELIPAIKKKLGVKDEMAYLEHIAQLSEDQWLQSLGEQYGLRGKLGWEISMTLANAAIYPENIKTSCIKIVQMQHAHHTNSPYQL